MSNLLPSDPKSILLSVFDAALKGADPMVVVPAALPARPAGPIIAVGAGKASAAMAQALERHWGGDIAGVVMTRDGYARAAQSIEILEAAHPVPDARGLAGTKRIMSLVRNAPNLATIVGLWSGGASSLLVQPVDGLSLKEKQSVTRQLLNSGLPVQDINTVRKHLSLVKGGRLAQLVGESNMLNLFISDVVGDDLSIIASGPIVADPSTCADASAIVSRAGIKLPDTIHEQLKQGVLETPKSITGAVENVLVATPGAALTSAAAEAQKLGLQVVNLGDHFDGEAKLLANQMADRILREVPVIDKPTAFLSGGEVTVTLDDGHHSCRGGPNLEFCLSLCLSLNGHAQVWALACDTDGTDGASDSAGAVVTPDTLEQAQRSGRDPKVDLVSHNSESFFAAVDGLVTPGPTATNVNDFRMVLVLPSA